MRCDVLLIAGHACSETPKKLAEVDDVASWELWNLLWARVEGGSLIGSASEDID